MSDVGWERPCCGNQGGKRSGNCDNSHCNRNSKGKSPCDGGREKPVAVGAHPPDLLIWAIRKNGSVSIVGSVSLLGSVVQRRRRRWWQKHALCERDRRKNCIELTWRAVQIRATPFDGHARHEMQALKRTRQADARAKCERWPSPPHKTPNSRCRFGSRQEP